MAGLTPRRLTGATLRMSARAERIPFLGAGVRLAGRSMVPLDALREARLGPVRPLLVPDDVTRRPDEDTS